MKNVSCVILNYNDAKTAIKLAERILNYDSLRTVIIVDNGSTDQSAQQLNAFCRRVESAKLVLLFAKKNGGYGAGNNRGIRYAKQHLHADYVLIANPDVVFSDQCVKTLARAMEKNSSLGVVTAKMIDRAYPGEKNYWPLFGVVKSLARSGPILRRLGKRWLNYPDCCEQGKKIIRVGAVHGSMLMVDAGKMLECGAFDEHIFLYHEEETLAQRMNRCGYKTAVVLTQTYLHEHSVSIKKSLKSAMDRQRIRDESALYYYQHYLQTGRAGRWFIRLFFAAVHLEIRIFDLLSGSER